jgi:hypothetical protein
MLRGIGASVALPLLDAMLPTGTLASAASSAVGGGAASPVRMAAFFIPNGVNIPYWTPSTLGSNFALPPTLEPLAAVKEQITVLSGLTLDNAWAKGDGPGDHARSAAAFLTGAHPFKTAGSNIKLGISVDQVAASKIGNQTRFPSLELGLDKSQTVGNCDSGYSCAYVSNIAWRSETTPLPNEVDPASLFDRLFGSDDDRAAAGNRLRRLRNRKSILDFVAEDARGLNRQLGKADQRKLDEFTTSIREIERRVEKAQQDGTDEKLPSYQKPEGIPADFTEHMHLMCDMLVLAFQMDLTRVSTVLVARDGSDRLYRWLGVTEGHHTLSHHGQRAQKIEQIRKIDQYHIAQFAYFVQKLQSIKEGDKTLLDNCMVMIGSGIGDGDRHNHDELPILLAGRGGGAISPGRHIRYPRNTPLCNLYVNMLEAMNVKVDRFGDSKGRLPQLTV